MRNIAILIVTVMLVLFFSLIVEPRATQAQSVGDAIQGLRSAVGVSNAEFTLVMDYAECGTVKIEPIGTEIRAFWGGTLKRLKHDFGVHADAGTLGGSMTPVSTTTAYVEAGFIRTLPGECCLETNPQRRDNASITVAIPIDSPLNESLGADVIGYELPDRIGSVDGQVLLTEFTSHRIAGSFHVPYLADGGGPGCPFPEITMTFDVEPGYVAPQHLRAP